MVSHSWGDNVFRAFMRWAAASDPEWVERHIASYINIAGPVLGVPKAITALLSGAPIACFQPPFTTCGCEIYAGSEPKCMRCQEHVRVIPCTQWCSHLLVGGCLCSIMPS